jgi:hypothetical protein
MPHVENIVKKFPNAKLIVRKGKDGIKDNEIEKLVKRGKVFFTWCDSDYRVNQVMRKAGKTLGVSLNVYDQKAYN